jgi:hypothetical protein
VGRIPGYLRQPHYQVCLTLIYFCGLRFQEGVQLQAEIFRRYGPQYRARFGTRMLPSHRRAMPLGQSTLAYPRPTPLSMVFMMSGAATWMVAV